MPQEPLCAACNAMSVRRHSRTRLSTHLYTRAYAFSGAGARASPCGVAPGARQSGVCNCVYVAAVVGAGRLGRYWRAGGLAGWRACGLAAGERAGGGALGWPLALSSSNLGFVVARRARLRRAPLPPPPSLARSSSADAPTLRFCGFSRLGLLASGLSRRRVRGSFSRMVMRSGLPRVQERPLLARRCVPLQPRRRPRCARGRRRRRVRRRRRGRPPPLRGPPL